MMETGLTYTSTVVVSKENVAATMGSGDLNVFATPAMVALMENAAMSAVADELPEGSTTVGAMMNTTHIKPSAVGDTVSATAVLKEVEGRKLTFEVRAMRVREGQTHSCLAKSLSPYRCRADEVTPH